MTAESNAVPASHGAGLTPKRVIWITSDHMRYDHIAANGQDAMVSPALDRLHNAGVNFSQCYT